MNLLLRASAGRYMGSLTHVKAPAQQSEQIVRTVMQLLIQQVSSLPTVGENKEI